MGSLVGHVVPGILGIIMAIWWSFSIFRRYYLCLRAARARGVCESEGVSAKERKDRTLYLNTSSFPCPCLRSFPTEGFFKVTVVIIGVISELTTAFEGGKLVNLVNIQHITIYSFFGLNGLMDILTHYQAPLPPSMDYVSAALAFAMEGLVFLYHLHARTPMDVQVHMLLVYAVWACAAAVVVEGVYRDSVVVALARCYFVMLQGTWLVQAGFILYPLPGMEKWNEESHSQMMVVTVVFCAHNALIFVFMLALNWLMYFQTRSLPPRSVYRALRAIHTPKQLEEFNIDLDNFIELV